MLELFDKVMIKSKKIPGTIVDIHNENYIVESDIENVNDGYGGKWKLFDCKEDDLDKI